MLDKTERLLLDFLKSYRAVDFMDDQLTQKFPQPLIEAVVALRKMEAEGGSMAILARSMLDRLYTEAQKLGYSIDDLELPPELRPSEKAFWGPISIVDQFRPAIHRLLNPGRASNKSRAMVLTEIEEILKSKPEVVSSTIEETLHLISRISKRLYSESDNLPRDHLFNVLEQLIAAFPVEGQPRNSKNWEDAKTFLSRAVSPHHTRRNISFSRGLPGDVVPRAVAMLRKIAAHVCQPSPTVE